MATTTSSKRSASSRSGRSASSTAARRPVAARPTTNSNSVTQSEEPRITLSGATTPVQSSNPTETELSGMTVTPAPRDGAQMPSGSHRHYADTDLVTVLFGYGKVNPTDTSFVTGGGAGDHDKTKVYQVKGGVIRQVKYAHARHWRETWVDEKGHSGVIILPLDADEVDYARASGIQPMAPQRLAAMIAASDPAALAAALGPARLADLAETLLRAVPDAGKITQK